MKKILFFAATAMLFAACANEEVVAPQTAEVAANAISFDTYTASATRAGDAGVMTTDKMKQFAGFGVFAYYTDNTGYNSTTMPDFMFNEHVSWATTSWSYSPLKYWPNETTQDSQTEYGAATSDATDKLSFFAYAPYVETNTGTLTTKDATTMRLNPNSSSSAISAWHASETSGIKAISAEDYSGDPKIQWGFSDNLDNNVDLLWGVAPMGTSYQSVNPSITYTRDFGLPLTNMVKPDKDQKIKFLFQHALSRIGLSVVSAVDQIAAGDDAGVFNNGQTRVLIDEVEIFGDFGIQGVLNLNNVTPNVANWLSSSLVKTDDTDATGLIKFNGTNGYLAKKFRYEGVDGVTGAADAAAAATAFGALNEGVLPSEETLLVGGADPSKEVTDLTYAFGKTYYTLDGSDYVIATTKQAENVDAYTKSGDNYTQARKAGGADLVMDGTVKYYKLGLTNPVSVSSVGTGLTADAWYYVKGGSDGNWTYTKVQATGSYPTGVYYALADVTETELGGLDYAGPCYTELMPRYFMVIPTGVTPVKVKITYHVVTYDDKLNQYVSDVKNVITKDTSLDLKNGKAYNLKLILGLTSVKLDATVADWQVDGSTEVNLPRNNE